MAYSTKPKPSQGNPLEAVAYGKLEVSRFHNAQVLGPGAHKVVTFGITGHGKSSFLNFLLKEEVFSIESAGFMGALNSVTKKTQACTAMIGGEQWLLIDTPGFFDTDQLQEGINKEIKAQLEQQKQEFRLNMRRAFLDAGMEVSAFLLIYDGSARWSFQMTEQIKFLDSIKFPWSNSILVITHADTACKGIPEEKQRYDEFLKTVKDPKSKLPSQLKELVQSMSYRVIFVESQKKDANYHKSVVTRMQEIVTKIETTEGIHPNQLFAFFDAQYKEDCHNAYMCLLQKKKEFGKLQHLVKATKEDVAAFVRTGQKVAVDHEELIQTMKKIAQLADKQTLAQLHTQTTGGKKMAIAGVLVAAASVIAIPVTLGLSFISLGIGTVMAVGGTISALSSFIKSLKPIKEVKQAQSCLNKGQPSLQELYSHYRSILTKIDKAGLNQHPSASDSLVAHLLAVHAHGSHKRSPELLQAAQELSVFHTLRKATRGELTPEQTEKISDNCALPIGFNILAATMDVSQAVGTTLGVVSISTNSTAMDATLLHSSCIQTLAKECKAIKTLCKIRD